MISKKVSDNWSRLILKIHDYVIFKEFLHKENKIDHLGLPSLKLLATSIYLLLEKEHIYMSVYP